MSLAAVLAPLLLQGPDVDRSTYIGGGLIPAIIGVSPYKTPLDAYLQLIGEAPEEPFDPQREKRFKRGKRMEPYIVDMLREDHGITIVGRNQRYVDPEYQFLAAEIDFEWHDGVDERLRNGEIKTVAIMPRQVNPWGEEGTDEIPVHIAAQGMWGLGVTGRELCQYGVLFGMDNLVLYALQRDDETIASMRNEAVRFWHEHVIPRVPPAPRTLSDLAKLWPTDRGTKTEATPEVAEIIARHNQLGQQAKLCEIEREELRFKIAEFCADNADIITHDGRTLATYKSQLRTTLDSKRMKVEQPAIYKQFARSNTARVLLHKGS